MSLFGGGAGGFGSLAPASSSAFGTPAAGGFGSPSPFGAQPAAATSFGSPFGQSSASVFGAPAAAAPTGGLFGSPQATQPTGGLFGAAQPQPQQAGGGLFGAPAAQPSVFGQTAAAAASPFGAAAQPQQPSFGALGTPAPNAAQLGYATDGRGTRVAPFRPEAVKTAGTATTAESTQQFRSICAMPQYAGKSHEELRFEDYQAGCKGKPGTQLYPSIHPSKVPAAPGTGFGTALGGATGFGGAGGFGAAQQQSTFGGATTAFGQPQQQAQGGLFGQPAASSASLFGASASTFGQAQPSAFGGGGTGFGQQPSAFGAQPAGGGLFGQPQQQPQQQQQQTSSIFGQPAAAAGGGLFGQPASSAGFSFAGASAPTFGAAQPAGSSLFGGGATQSNTLFGGAQSAAAPFGAAASASAFGLNQQKPATGGLFGSTLNTGGSLFGGQPAAGGGLFGQSAAAPSPFGQAPQQPAQVQGGGLFGQQQSGPSLFGGGQPAGGGLFGQQQQNTGGSLFAAPASSAGGLFGNTGGGLFGSGAGLAAPASAPSLFGAATPALGGGGGGLFGATTQTATPLFGGLGGATAAPAAAAATAMPTPVAPGQVAPYGALPAIPQLKSPAGDASGAAGAAAAASRPLESVDVLFRPSAGARASALGRAHRRSGAPPSLDTEAAKKPPPQRRSPSIFKTAYRDGGLVINTPLPTTNGATSPPAASPGGNGASPPARRDSEGSPSAAAGPSAASPATSHRASQPLPAGPASSAGVPEIRPAPSAERSPARSTPGRASPAAQPSVSAAQSGPPLPAVPDVLYMRPSVPDLRALATVRADALNAVHGFTIGRDGVGEVLFLKPVDLSGGPDLGEVCSFEPGVVSLYHGDNAPEKPPVGQGLNCPARVTLWLDGASLNRILRKRHDMTPEAQVAKLQARLQRVCTDEHARFVSVRMDGENAAEWVFEVEHWSRYGLTSKAWSDDSDEDLTESLAAPPDSAGADSADAGAALQARAETSAEQEASGVARSDSPTGSFSLAPAGAADGAERNDSMMHDDDVIELDPALRPTSHYAPFAEPPPMAAVPYERPSDGPTRAPPPRGAFPATATDPGFMLSALPVRVPDASGGGARSTATEALNSAWAPTRVTLRAPLPRQEVSPPSEPLPDTLHPAIAALASATSGTLHGAMSRARRVACGAGGLVAMPAPSADSSEVRIARVQPGVTARPQQAQRRAVRLLEVHAQYSRRVEDGNAVVMADGPDWVFACTADMEPCAEFAAVCTDSAAEAPGASGPGGADAAAAAAFDLAHRLLARIAPLDGPAGADAVVTAAQRKREVSVWLEDQAEREVHTALKQIANRRDNRAKSARAAVLQLLSGHDLQGAATLATSSGHPQLASLVATAGLRPRGAALLAEQVGDERDASRRASWHSSGLLAGGHVAPALAATYQLLAGDAGAALAYLGDLTWPRALGLCLWYRAAPASPVGAALDAYEALVDAGTAGAPAPRPPHARSDAGDGAPVDARYALLQLHAAQGSWGAEANARATELAHRLARTDSYFADALDAVLPWLMLCLLRAADEGGPVSDDVFAAATLACADTLRLLGEPLWALHALVHLPPQYAEGKEAAIRAALEADFGALCACPGGHAEAERFLCHDRRVPRAWLAAAEAVYARQRSEHERAVRALLTAGSRSAAEAAFVADVVPPCVAARQDERLHELLEAFGGRAERSDFRVVQAYLRLRRVILSRGAPDLEEGAADAAERAAVIDALAGAADELTRLRARLAAGERAPSGEAAQAQPRLERAHALFTGMCEQLLKWLQSGPAESVSALGEPQLEAAVGSLPAEMLASHVLLQHCC